MVTAQAEAPSLPTHRPTNLPPPLDGEEELELELVCLVRDGSRSLENEDHLIEELVKVVRAHRVLVDDPSKPNLVRWRIPPMTEQAHESYESGFEIKFMAETGQPVAMTLRASLNHGEPIYTKRIPTMDFQGRPYLSPLDPRSPKCREYRAMGFKTTVTSGFPNFAAWEEHIQAEYSALLRSLDAMGTDEPLKTLWRDTMDAAETFKRQRRDSDPRLASEAVTAS